MDLLHKRYASPFSFVDGMIRTGQFSAFVDDFAAALAKDKEEQTTWEYYLHRVYDKSFADFREAIENDERNKKMSERTIETTIQKSMDILKNFKPS